MYLRGLSRGKNIKYKKVNVFYELIDERCIIFLFLLQSLFSANKNVEFFFFFGFGFWVIYIRYMKYCP